MSPLALLFAAASISMASGISWPHWATHTIGQLQPPIQVGANNSTLNRRAVKKRIFYGQADCKGGDAYGQPDRKISVFLRLALKGRKKLFTIPRLNPSLHARVVFLFCDAWIQNLSFELKLKLINHSLQRSGKNGGWSGSGLRG